MTFKYDMNDKYDVAGKYLNEFEEKFIITNDDDRELIKSCKTLMEIDDHPWIKTNLASAYERNNRYDLAENIYKEITEMEVADEEDIDKRKPFISYAHYGLGLIYKNGYLGNIDNEQAFFHFTIAANLGFLASVLEIATFHRDGIIVKKDENMYIELLEYVYGKVHEEDEYDNWTVVAACNMLAHAYYKKGMENKAFKLLQEGIREIKSTFRHQLRRDQQQIKGTVNLYYKIKGIDKAKLDFLSLYEVLKKPCKIRFTIGNKDEFLEAKKDNDKIYVSFKGKNYKDFQEFYEKARINNEALVASYKNIKNIQYA